MLQTTFYILGIITMLIWLLIALFIIILYFKVKNKIEETKNNFPKKIADRCSGHAAEIIGIIFVLIGKLIGRKIKNKIK